MITNTIIMIQINIIKMANNTIMMNISAKNGNINKIIKIHMILTRTISSPKTKNHLKEI